MTRWLSLVLMTVALAIHGCSGTRMPPAKPVAKKPKKAEAKKAEPKHLDIAPIEVKADEFASVEEALTELDRVLTLSGEERNRAEIRVQNWLTLQQDKAVPLVAGRASDSQQSLEMRLTVARILGKLGPDGIDTLIALTAKDEAGQLRRRAVETLGLMKPPAPKTVTALIALLDDPDTQVQWQVIRALDTIGEPAKPAASKLSELRQNHADESIRVSAGQALKKVDPRTSFVD